MLRVEGVLVLACSRAAPVAAVGRHAAAAIVAPPIRNRRRDGEESADDPTTGLLGVAGLMADIPVLLHNRRWCNVNPRHPQVLSDRPAFWTIGPFSFPLCGHLRTARGALPARDFWRLQETRRSRGRSKRAENSELLDLLGTAVLLASPRVSELAKLCAGNPFNACFEVGDGARLWQQEFDPHALTEVC